VCLLCNFIGKWREINRCAGWTADGVCLRGWRGLLNCFLFLRFPAGYETTTDSSINTGVSKDRIFINLLIAHIFSPPISVFVHACANYSTYNLG